LPKKDWISAMLACEVWDVAPSCWKYLIQSSSSSNPALHTPAWPKFSPFSATASFRRDFGHHARPIWHHLLISYVDIWKGEFIKQTMNHRCLESKHHQRNSGSDSRHTGKDFKIWRAEFNPVWTQMVANSSTRYDVTFLTQWGKSASYFVAISSSVVKLLKEMPGLVASGTHCTLQTCVPFLESTFFSPIVHINWFQLHCLSHRFCVVWNCRLLL